MTLGVFTDNHKNIYPNEPKANNTDKIRIAKSGALLNKHKVTTREIVENGQVLIQTEHQGKDDNKKAVIRYTYTIGLKSFSIKKDIQFEGADNWVKRSEYNYIKKE